MIVEQCDILQAYSDRFSVIRETFEAINETSVEEKRKLLPDNISKTVEDMSFDEFAEFAAEKQLKICIICLLDHGNIDGVCLHQV